MRGKFHHLVSIAEHPVNALDSVYKVACGRTWLLREQGLLACSHFGNLITCKHCRAAYKRAKKKEPTSSP